MEEKIQKNRWVRASLRLLGSMIIYAIMCLIVSVALTSLLRGKAGILLAQAFDLCIILPMTYLTVWRMGDADCNRIRYGRIRRDNLLGFKMGLIACSPWIVCAALLVCAKAGLLSAAILPLYRIVNAPFMPLCQALMPTVFTLAEQSWIGVILSALTVFVPVVSLGVGYRLGLERASFVDDVIYNGRPHKSK